jgi:hypothetical protein
MLAEQPLIAEMRNKREINKYLFTFTRSYQSRIKKCLRLMPFFIL